jgi:hypothetical protein
MTSPRSAAVRLGGAISGAMVRPMMFQSPDREGQHRLNVQHIRSLVVVRPGITERVVLKRQADHRRDRVLRDGGQRLG